MKQGLFYFYPDHQGRYLGASRSRSLITDHRKRLLMGMLAGAAVAYVISNKKVRSSIAAMGASAASAARGEVEELNERLADSQAELEYLRSQLKEQNDS